MSFIYLPTSKNFPFESPFASSIREIENDTFPRTRMRKKEIRVCYLTKRYFWISSIPSYYDMPEMLPIRRKTLFNRASVEEGILNCIKWKYFYTTKGRDRFHWAATPLKPYKVGNICYMTYRYSVLYFLNLSLKHFFPTENGNFCENIQIRRPLSFRVLTSRACPIDVLPNRR